MFELDFGFNPTLVRLRHAAFPQVRAFIWLFQSHAGSIEAHVGPRRSRRDLPFQSHAGSIEAGSGEGAGNVCLRVSIPRWFD